MRTIVLSAVFAAGLAFFGCSGSEFMSGDAPPDSMAGATGAAGAPAVGQAGAGSGGGENPTCDATARDLPDDDFEDTNCDGIDGDASRAVFVSPDGDDLAAGTQDDPVATINAGIELAQEGGLDVYVCNGEYDREVRLESIGVNIYGGYDCKSDWKRVRDRAVVRPQVGVPLTIRDVSGVTIERIVFRALNNESEEGSSIAAAIVDSEDVELRRVELESGRAGSGKDGTDGKSWTSAARKGDDGNRATGCGSVFCATGGTGGHTTEAYTCPDGTKTRGGPGSRGEYADGTGPQNGAASLLGAPGGTSSDRSGTDGDGGDVGAHGQVSTKEVGTFTGVIYEPVNAGGEGGDGETGQGGGGGRGSPRGCVGDLCYTAGHGGGQGGNGGCGGRPGTGGTGGGGSFGLVIVGSEVSLTWARILTGDGGVGGAGGEGGPGQVGGDPGAGYGSLAGDGGRGGDGGKGGAGGPGGGGPSIGIALVNAEVPTTESVQFLLGDGGRGGAAAPDAGSDAPDGISVEGYDFTAGVPLSF